MLSEKTFVIGRSRSCDLILSDEEETVSRKHAEFTITPDGRFFLTDCNSTNGTWLIEHGEARRIRQEYVSAEDTVQFGGLRKPVKGLLEAIHLKFPSVGGAPFGEQGGGVQKLAPPEEQKVQGDKLFRDSEGRILSEDEYREKFE